jgi:hypothetical protein
MTAMRPPYSTRWPLFCLLLAACTSVVDPATAKLTFQPAALPVVDPARLPFPSEAYRQDGRLRLAPGPSDAFFVAEILLPAIADLDGFGNQQPVFFGIGGPDEQARRSWPIDDARLAAAVGLVDADVDSPDWGKAVPHIAHIDRARGLVAVAPALGQPLRAGGSYVAWVSDDLGAALGISVGADAPWLRIRGGRPVGEAEQAVADSLAGAWDALAAAGVNRAKLLAASAFAVQDPTADLLALADDIYAVTAPAAPVFRAVYYADDLSGAAPLTDLFGTPTGPWGGTDNPGGVRHEHIRAVFTGSFVIPRWSDFAARLPFARDAAGRPRVILNEEVEFVLALPDCPAPAEGYPAIIAQHGLNDHKRFSLQHANALAAECMVTVGIDAVGHGFRSRLPVDRKGNLTDQEQPDGIADGFSVGGLDQVFLVQPLVARTNLIETAAGLVALGDRLARAVWQPPAATGLAPIAIDAAQIGYVGQSMGAIVGSMATAASRDIRASVINVGGGNYRHIFTDSPAFAMALPAVGPIAEGDVLAEVDAFHPGLALFGAVMEGADPVNFGRLWTREPAAGAAPRHVLMQIAEFDQLIANSTSAMLATAAGYPLLGEMRPRTALYAEAPIIELPQADTVDGPDGLRYGAGLVVFPMAEHGFAQTRCNAIRFVYEPPYGIAPEEVPLANPTDAAQRQTARFLRSALAGSPEILPVEAGVLRPSDCP